MKKIVATAAIAAALSIAGVGSASAATHPAPPNPCNVQVGTCHIRFR